MPFINLQNIVVNVKSIEYICVETKEEHKGDTRVVLLSGAHWWLTDKSLTPERVHELIREVEKQR